MSAARRKAGFTLIEALATLGILGLAVSVIFMVGARSSAIGMRLGFRALNTSEMRTSQSAYRDTITSILPPTQEALPEAAALEQEELGIDETFLGAPEELSGWYVGVRETPCAQTGVVGRMTVYPEQTGSLATTVYCRVGEGDNVPLMTLRWPGARFSYSEDGIEWFDEWIVERGQPVENAYLPDGQQRKVLVRLSSTDDRSQIVELTQSGRNVPVGP